MEFAVTLLKGRRQRNAPFVVLRKQAFSEQVEGFFLVKVKKMEKWECTVCGYIYDPEVGDQDNNIAAGTSFEDLPEDWTCPVCNAPKDLFVKRE